MIAIAASPDGRLIATPGPTAAVWDAETGERAFSVEAGDGVEDLAWSPDGRVLAAVGFGGAATIVDRSGASVTSLPHDREFRVSAVGFSPDGRLLATAAIPLEVRVPGLETVTIWDRKSGRAVETITTYAEAVSFEPAGSRIATAAVFGTAGV
ncbi:MAG TPA: hypothetical protein VHL78_11975 [Actinomycetota bacterium]|nr:hypothetical protein [Actinomycetota bacterium]